MLKVKSYNTVPCDKLDKTPHTTSKKEPIPLGYKLNINLANYHLDFLLITAPRQFTVWYRCIIDTQAIIGIVSFLFLFLKRTCYRKTLN